MINHNKFKNKGLKEFAIQLVKNVRHALRLLKAISIENADLHIQGDLDIWQSKRINGICHCKCYH